MRAKCHVVLAGGANGHIVSGARNACAMKDHRLPVSGTAASRRREGPFWDAVEGRAPLPAAAVTLGWELVSASPEDGTIEVAFNASEAFLNPAGFIQGGFLAAMLDDTMGPALVAGLNPGDFAPTTDLHVQFLRPVRPGRLIGRGRVVRRGKDVGFLAGELVDNDGAVVAVATATVQIRAQMLADRERADAGRDPTG